MSTAPRMSMKGPMVMWPLPPPRAWGEPRVPSMQSLNLLEFAFRRGGQLADVVRDPQLEAGVLHHRVDGGAGLQRVEAEQPGLGIEPEQCKVGDDGDRRLRVSPARLRDSGPDR